MSSAKSRSYRRENRVDCIPRERIEVVCRITQSMVIKKRIGGESMQPWRTPYFTGNVSVRFL